MPQIFRLTNSVSIYIYADHAPPHFHVEGPNTSVMIAIETLAVIEGEYDRRDYDAAIEWAA